MIHQLNEMWKDRLQKTYNNDFEYFSHYDDIYGIARRLGFRNAEEAWEANPMIQGSVNPQDLKVSKGYKKKTVYNPANDWKMRQANDDTFRESKMIHQITEDRKSVIKQYLEISNEVKDFVLDGENDIENLEFAENDNELMDLVDGAINAFTLAGDFSDKMVKELEKLKGDIERHSGYEND